MGESLDKALSNYSQQCPIARLKDASAQADINNEVKSWSNFINEIQG